MPKTMAPRLPQEIVNLIIDFLWNHDDALRACARVSRCWHLYVVQRRLLAGRLNIGTASASAYLVKSLRAEAKRLHHVHTANLTEASPDGTPWVHRALLALCTSLPAVTDFVLREWRPARVPLHPLVFIAFSQFRAVDTLILEDCTFASATQLQHLLGEFPQLRLLCLAEWFAGDGATLGVLRVLHLRITHELQKGELASLGQLVEVVGPCVRWLCLDFADPPSDWLASATNWHELKLERRVRIQVLRTFRSIPVLQELALLSPECRVRVLELRRWGFPYEQKTEWSALAMALESDVFADLRKVVNARSLQSGEMRDLEAFIRRMHARGVEFEDRMEHPFWDWGAQLSTPGEGGPA